MLDAGRPQGKRAALGRRGRSPGSAEGSQPSRRTGIFSDARRSRPAAPASPDQGKPMSVSDSLCPLALPPRARPPARRDPDQALDRQRDPGPHPARCRWPSSRRSIPDFFSVDSLDRHWRGRWASSMLHRARPDDGHGRRRHRPQRRLDLRAGNITVRSPCSTCWAGRSPAVVLGATLAAARARPGQRPAGRLSAAARLPHHAGHADHRPRGRRHAAPEIFGRRSPPPSRRPTSGTTSARARCSACRSASSWPPSSRSSPMSS